MSETAEIYQRVTSKCPAAKVEFLEWKPRDGKFNTIGKWLRSGHRWTEDDVEALICSHWLTLLDHNEMHGLHHTDNDEYTVWDKYGTGLTDMFKTPFLALAAYLESLP